MPVLPPALMIDSFSALSSSDSAKGALPSDFPLKAPLDKNSCLVASRPLLSHCPKYSLTLRATSIASTPGFCCILEITKSLKSLSVFISGYASFNSDNFLSASKRASNFASMAFSFQRFRFNVLVVLLDCLKFIRVNLLGLRLS